MERCSADRRKQTIRRRAILYATVSGLALGACGPKGPDFFAPDTFINPPTLVDITGPTIRNLQPAGNVVLNDDGLGFEAFDGPGAAGEPISGLNVQGLNALGGSTPLAVRSGLTPNGFVIDIVALVEGPNTVGLSARDIAGNLSTAQYAFRKDRTAPTFSATVPTTGSTTQPSARINVRGQYADPNGFSLQQAYVRQPVNGQCTVDGALFPQGTGPGQVTQNPVPLNNVAGQFDVNFDLNGAPNDMRPRTTTYCLQFAVADPAVDRFGIPRPNRTDRLFPLTYTWEALPPTPGSISGRVTTSGTTPLAGVTVSAGGQTRTTDAGGNYTFTNLAGGSYTVALSNLPSGVQCTPASKTALVTAGQNTVVDFSCTQTNFTITLQLTYVHVAPGVSYACVRITGAAAPFVRGAENVTLENIAGAAWSVQWSGPGTVGSTQRSGTLDAQSQALDRQQINQFGSYTANVSVTSNGVTKQASGTVSVGGTQGTCTPP